MTKIITEVINSFLEYYFSTISKIVEIIVKISIEFSTEFANTIVVISTKFANNLLSNSFDSKKKSSAVGITIRISLLYLTLGLLVGLVYKTFILVPLFTTSFFVHIALVFYILLFALALLALTGKDKKEMKSIADFCNKSILPFITVVFLIIGLPLSDSAGFSMLNSGTYINYSGIYFQVTPLLFTVLINLRLLWMNIDNAD